MIDKKRLYDRMVRLIETPSVSGTAEEVTAAVRIEELLYEVPYFQQHKENVMRVPLEGDPFNRFLVAAYVELVPDCPDTVILTGHYDVVDVEEFGELKPLAYDVEKITEAIGQMQMEEACRKDLESGEWYFGRGTADMKFGHALCMELMQHYAEEGGLKGNLLYVAVCGEETNSEGMLGALPFFNDFAKKKNLKYKVMLLTECFMVDKPDDGTKYIQYGGAGKVMPMFFCAGFSTHGEEPFLGLDASLLSGEVFRRMHLNPDFCQQNHGITTAPPAGLKLQDLKTNYSLSSSLYSASYYNIATIKLQPEEVMKKLIALAEEAFKSANALVEEKIAGFTALTGREPEAYRAEPCVKTFQELYSAVEKNYDGDLRAYFKEYAQELMKENPEMQDTCVKLVKRLYEMYGEKKPMIIVSIIPPYYPDVNIDMDDADTVHMLQCIDELIQYAAEAHGEKLGTSEYYGISDLCYTWLAEGMDFDGLFGNLAGVDMVYQFPMDALKEFKVPAMVLGGYGKDMHKYTERLHKHYNFDVLPDLYLHYLDQLLNK